eukprot:13773673-Alexandrium_andersonii.AAC.1
MSCRTGTRAWRRPGLPRFAARLPLRQLSAWRCWLGGRSLAAWLPVAARTRGAASCWPGSGSC